MADTKLKYENCFAACLAPCLPPPPPPPPPAEKLLPAPAPLPPTATPASPKHDTLYSVMVRRCMAKASEYLVPRSMLRRRGSDIGADVQTTPATTDATIPKPSGPAFKLAATHPAFELVESVVIDDSGDRLFGDVKRGSTRLETLHFRVHAPIGLLHRKTTTAMKIVGMWQVVATEHLELGVYAPDSDATTHKFAMPKAVIPSTAFAKGRFRTEVEYTCDALPGEVLRKEEEIEYSIV